MASSFDFRKKKKKKEKCEQRQIKKAVISSEAEVLSEGENQQEVKSLNMNQK